MRSFIIILCCVVFVTASLSTDGLLRAVIDLCAFVLLLYSLLGMKSSNKTDDVEQ
ncbi:hypothetical protein [Shewanella waksmanii]|uniref:hypothetical protein n=1 Tax=Shewanella waksmanii TaxID=213783 RepID=UPI00373625F6